MLEENKINISINAFYGGLNKMTNFEEQESKKDFIEELRLHRSGIGENINHIIRLLEKRIKNHDSSKLKGIEFETYGKYHNLRKEEKDSKKITKLMKPGKDEHYKHNRHHLEYFGGDVSKTNLIDLIEIIVDWFTESEQENTDINKTIEEKSKKYNIPIPITNILYNTVEELKKKGG